MWAQHRPQPIHYNKTDNIVLINADKGNFFFTLGVSGPCCLLKTELFNEGAEQLTHARIQSRCWARCVPHSAGLAPAAAPKLSPSTANSPSLENWSMPNDEKSIHLNWSGLQDTCLQREEQTLSLHGMFSLRISISINFYIINSVNHTNTLSTQCIPWLQMKKNMYKSHFFRSTFLLWAFCL